MTTVTIVLRPGMGLDFEGMAPALTLGAPVSIGRGGAVIAALSDDNAVERLSALDDKLAEEGWQQELTPELLGMLMAGYERQEKMTPLLADCERLLGEYQAGTNALEAFICEISDAVGEIRRLAERGQKEEAAEHLCAIEVLAGVWLESCKAGLPRHEITKPENVAREVQPAAPDSVCDGGDIYRADSYGAGFMAANNGVCENCDAAEQAGATMAKNAKVRTGEETALVAAPSAEDEQSHAEYRAAQLAGQIDVEVPTSIWKAGYAAGMARATGTPSGDEHLPLLQGLLEKLMTIGFEAAQQCERHALDEGDSQVEAEAIGGWVLRGFAIAKLKLQPLVEADLFTKLAPGASSQLVPDFNLVPAGTRKYGAVRETGTRESHGEHAGALVIRAQGLLGQAVSALGAERLQQMEVVELLTKDLDAHRAALGNDHHLKVAAPKMLATLHQVLTKVGGLFAVLDHGGKPSEQMWEEANQAIQPIWDLVAEVEGRHVSDVVEEAVHG
jgi:hypothetical protein